MVKKSRRPLITVVPHAGYPFDVMLAVGASDDEVIAAIEKRTELVVSDEDREMLRIKPDGRGRAVMLARGQTVIRLWHFDNSPDAWGHLSHEIFHAVDFLMRRIGIRLSPDSDEAYAYAVGNLTKRLAVELRRANG